MKTILATSIGLLLTIMAYTQELIKPDFIATEEVKGTSINSFLKIFFCFLV